MKTVLVFVGLLAVASATPVSTQGICGRSEYGSKLHPDCTKFYTCNNGFLSVQSCPPNLYFNGDYCDYPENVLDCVDGWREIPEGDEPEEVVPEYPAPISEEEEEVPPVDHESEEPGEEPQPPASEEAPEEQPVQDGECPNVPFYYLAHPTDANAFFICLNGTPSGSGKCGVDLVFSQDKQYCH